MPARILGWYAERGLPAASSSLPRSRGSRSRRFIWSVAVPETASSVSLVADRVGRPVVAGPVEATAIGNVLLQARALGLLRGDLEDLRGSMATTLAGMRFAPQRAPAGRV